jgi:phosphoribosylanthranilate isomerase
MTRIKVCGITDEGDALEAVHLGVDALGFDFRKGSPRLIAPRDASRIVSKLPPFLARVGVFADEAPDQVLSTAEIADLTVLEFRGEESPEFCRRFPLRWYKGFRARRGFDPAVLTRWACTTYLIEVVGEDGADGPGSAACAAAASAARYGRVILSGGLTAENVGDAIAAARPYAVDVSAGIEIVPGKKDIDRLEAFIENVRATDARLSPWAGVFPDRP